MSYDYDACLLLIAAVVGKARYTPEYYAGPCGHWWLGLVGVDPAAAYHMAAKGTPGENIPYKRRDTCSCGATDRYD